MNSEFTNHLVQEHVQENVADKAYTLEAGARTCDLSGVSAPSDWDMISPNDKELRGK